MGKLFLKGPDSVLGFVGYRVSIVITLFCHHSVNKSVEDTSTNGYGCVPIILYIQKQAAVQIWSVFGIEGHRRTSASLLGSDVLVNI